MDPSPSRSPVKKKYEPPANKKTAGRSTSKKNNFATKGPGKQCSSLFKGTLLHEILSEIK